MEVEMRFSGKVAIVTGGNSGIGRETALQLARDGARVVVGARREKECAETVEMIRAAGGEAMYVVTDVSRSDEVARLVGRTLEAYQRLDYAANVAGIPGIPGLLHEEPEEHFDQVLDINVKGTWLLLKHEIPAMLKSGGGSIVNMSSFLGTRAFNIGLSAYIASKHGVIGLTRVAAVQYAPMGVRVNVVCPAYIDTPMTAFLEDPAFRTQIEALHPVKRIGTPSEVAKTITWLCSDDASFVTGHVMMVDGGYTAQ
jgi:NAD(P)-dependent dehydrogenase (short-subunit alcohol dehydrogenase family)